MLKFDKRDHIKKSISAVSILPWSIYILLNFLTITVDNCSDLDGNSKEITLISGIVTTCYHCLFASYIAGDVLHTTANVTVLLWKNVLDSYGTTKKKHLKQLIDFVSYNYRLGDSDVEKNVFAQTSKHIGYSAQVQQSINKAKFEKTVYVTKTTAKKTDSSRFTYYDVISGIFLN